MQLPHRKGALHARETILIVDPDPSSRDILQTIFHHAGFATLLADEVDEGIRLAKWRSPSIIVTELFHRTEGGWEILERLSSDASTALIPVLAFSARVLPDDQDAAERGGVARFIPKPTAPRELEAIVEEVLWDR